jgi:enterochelin esterase-like enzyme
MWASERSRAALPLLVVHDGSEYARRARLLHVLADAVADGRLRPLRAALLEVSDRNEAYSASAAYARRLTRHVAPALPPASARIGVGASLGALALLHAHVAEPGLFSALFVQSGSFFRIRTDPQERSFPRFARIARFVRAVQGRPIPVTMTCGAEEENLANNRLMRDTLLAQGYDVRLHELRGAHDWRAWSRALDPYLPDLVERALP